LTSKTEQGIVIFAESYHETVYFTEKEADSMTNVRFNGTAVFQGRRRELSASVLCPV